MTSFHASQYEEKEAYKKAAVNL